MIDTILTEGGHGWVQTHRKAASVSAPMHPLHVQHWSEQTDMVVDSTERLHAFKQLERRQTETHNALSLLSMYLKVTPRQQQTLP